MTPLHLMILLHYYGSAEEYARRDPEHANSDAVVRFKLDLEGWGLLEAVTTGDATSARWRTTDRGNAHVEKLKALPLPIVKMVWE